MEPMKTFLFVGRCGLICRSSAGLWWIGTPAMTMMSLFGMHCAGSDVMISGLPSILVMGSHCVSSFTTSTSLCQSSGRRVRIATRCPWEHASGAKQCVLLPPPTKVMYSCLPPWWAAAVGPAQLVDVSLAQAAMSR